ncbi:MAG: hypothetical protein ACREBC_03795, partial [Pyrinomonadaceae bacterium]
MIRAGKMLLNKGVTGVFAVLMIAVFCSSQLPVSAANRSYLDAKTSSTSMVIMMKDKKDGDRPPFYEALRKALKKRKTKIEDICPVGDAVA